MLRNIEIYCKFNVLYNVYRTHFSDIIMSKKHLMWKTRINHVYFYSKNIYHGMMDKRLIFCGFSLDFFFLQKRFLEKFASQTRKY